MRYFFKHVPNFYEILTFFKVFTLNFNLCNNGFDIRNMRHLVTKTVPHAILQILMTTDIQKIDNFK